jgi:hypothetical protein
MEEIEIDGLIWEEIWEFIWCNNYRTGAALYALQTWVVSGKHLQIPCIKVTMIIIIIIIIISKVHPRTGQRRPIGGADV